MRIAQVCPKYAPQIGGIESHVKEVSHHLAIRGYEVEVLTTDPTGLLPTSDEVDGVPVSRFRSFAPGDSYFFSAGLENYLRRNSNRFDIIHAHGYHSLPAYSVARTKASNIMVFTPHFHGTGHTTVRRLLHVLYKPFGRQIFRKADKIISVSRFEQTLTRSSFEIEEEKLCLIPNGINLEEFQALPRVAKHLSILYVGRLERYKGVDSIIRTLPYLDNNVRLEIVGDGPFKNSLNRLAVKLGVANRVRLQHYLPRRNLLTMYAEAGIFAQLSKYEAFGISTSEALAAGTVCIVNSESGLREFVDGKNCIGVNSSIDLRELAGLISAHIGKKANCSLESFISWSSVTNKLILAYEELVKDASHCRETSKAVVV